MPGWHFILSYEQAALNTECYWQLVDESAKILLFSHPKLQIPTGPGNTGVGGLPYAAPVGPSDIR